MAKRINKIQEFLDEKDIDALLIKSKTVKKWMNTMTGSGCQVLITKEHGYFIVDGRYITEAKEKEHDLEIILHNPHLTWRNYLGTVEEILKKENRWKWFSLFTKSNTIKSLEADYESTSKWLRWNSII